MKYAALSSRRRALGATVALPWVARPVLAQETADVIIIGAGLAGLNAALNLEAAGMSVIVLEAADYVGGRTRTFDLPVGPINAGGQTVGPYYARIRDIVDRLKVPTIPAPRSLAMGNYVNGLLVASKDWAASKANRTVGVERAIQPVGLEYYYMSRKNNPLPDPESWGESDQARYDVPLADFLRGKGASDEALRLINVTINAFDLSSASALAYLRDVKWLEWGVASTDTGSRGTYDVGSGGDYNEIAGGTQRLPEAMARALKQDVRLNTLVRAIDSTDRGVEVATHDGRRYGAKYAIAAVPFSALRNIDIQPGLTGAQADAVRSSAHGNAVRVFMEFTGPFWESDIGEPSLYSDTAIERVFANPDDAGKPFALNCWVNGSGANRLDQLPETAVADFVVAELARIRPSSKGRVKVLKVHSWAKHSASGCCRHVFNAGQVTAWADAVATPHGRLHFAGEQTRRIESGMEAAAVTGERAAYEIIERES
jgi:monoamine oxidase